MTFPIPAATLSDLLEPHVGERVTVVDNGDHLVLSEPLPATLHISMPAPGVFAVTAVFVLGDAPLGAAFGAANVTNLGNGALGNVSVFRDQDGLNALFAVTVHGPIDAGREFASAIGRVLATVDKFLDRFRSLVAQAEAMAQLEASMSVTPPTQNVPVVASSQVEPPAAGTERTPGPSFSFNGYL